MSELTYRLVDEGSAIQCLVCGRTSHNTNDVAYRYCGFCHRFHDDMRTDTTRNEDDETTPTR